jgi:hypothetical protein
MRRSHPANKNIYKALRDAKVDYARLQPWFAFPRLGVAELEAPKDGKTYWDFAEMDHIVLDFFAASEGRPVIVNFSTIPEWMIKTDKPVAYPSDPGEIFWGYGPGKELRDTTLKELVEYYNRLASWYMKGGFTDEYGKIHTSNYNFKIDYWEVLNEIDLEHQFSPQQLTKIYDAIVTDLHKLIPDMKFSALALAYPHNGMHYFEYFLNPKNHRPGIPLDMFSYHVYISSYGDKWNEGAELEKQQYAFFKTADGFLKDVDRIDSIKQSMSPDTKTCISELGTQPPGNPSDPALLIPENWWPLSNAIFAYVYPALVKKGVEIVDIAELIDYPGMFPGTTILDWNTGLPNARYRGMKLLKDNFGPGDDLIKTEETSEKFLAQAFIVSNGARKVLLVNKTNREIAIIVPEAKNSKMNYVDQSTGSNPPGSIILKDDKIILSAFRVAVIEFPAVDQGLIIYDAPSGAGHNEDYTIQVRKEGGTWQYLFGYNAVNMNKGPYPGPAATPLNSQTFAYFDSDFRQRIEVKVTKNRGAFTNARIRPYSYGITFTQSGNSISFFLDQPRKISVEFEKDIYHNLFLFANRVETNPPREGDKGVTYFGPGFHDAGTINLASGGTIYLAGGSIVRGNIKGSEISDASVRGHGILQNGGIRIYNSDNIAIEGIIIIDSPGWCIVPSQVDNSIIRDVKIINKGVSTDGADPSGCRNLTFDNVFFRIPDDCISVKCYRVARSNLDMIIQNSVFWSDAAHCILIGPEGNGLSTERVLISNCDFLECKYTSSDYWGVFGITNGDNMTIRDITIENCRVDDFSYSNLVAFRIETNEWVKAPGGPIKNIVFRNISYNGKNINTNYIKGYDNTRCVDSVTFENLKINGQRIMSAKQGRFQIGPYATNVVFK